MRQRWRQRSAQQDTDSPPLVMVADDDVLVRELLATGLRRQGFAVRVFGNGRELLRAAENERPAVVVVDWLMPGPQGPDVCAALKQGDTTARVPVVMLTSRGMDRHVELALEAGADDYVTKPFHVDDVARVVQQLLSTNGAA